MVIAESNHGARAPRPAASRVWLSAHLYLAPYPGQEMLYGAPSDEAVRGWVVPVLERARREGLATLAFFIRYAEHGVHLRLRLLPRDVDATARLEKLVSDAAQTYGGRLVWIPYEPEYTRYGGYEAVELAEECFHASSILACRMLEAMPTPRSARLGRALVATLALVHAALPDRQAAAAFCDEYRRGYLKTIDVGDPSGGQLTRAFDAGYERQASVLAGQVADVWDALEAGEPVDDAVDAWHTRMRSLFSSLRELGDEGRVARSPQYLPERSVIDHVLPSYVHMNNNRLGVSIPEETYLARVLTRALDGGTAW